MKLYIKDLIKRLSLFSEELDNKTLFTNRKWILVNDTGNQETFIFEGDGNLIMSINGKVKDATWRYIPEANSILIDRGPGDKILLNHAFLDEGVMILKYDGNSNENLFMLANQNIISDLNVEKYLNSRLDDLIDIKRIELNNGKHLEIYADINGGIKSGAEVTIDGSYAGNTIVLDKSDEIKYYIKDSKILQKKFLVHRMLANGTEITLEQEDQIFTNKGDRVFIDGRPAATGKYKLGFLKFMVIVDGVIVRIN